MHSNLSSCLQHWIFLPFPLLPPFLLSFLPLPSEVKLPQTKIAGRQCDKYVRRPGWSMQRSSPWASPRGWKCSVINSLKQTNSEAGKAAMLRAGTVQFGCWLLISLENSIRFCPQWKRAVDITTSTTVHYGSWWVHIKLLWGLGKWIKREKGRNKSKGRLQRHKIPVNQHLGGWAGGVWAWG